MLLPFLLGMVVLVVLPAAGSLAVAFFDYSPFQPATFLSAQHVPELHNVVSTR